MNGRMFRHEDPPVSDSLVREAGVKMTTTRSFRTPDWNAPFTGWIVSLQCQPDCTFASLSASRCAPTTYP
jgi:hypothetical protein